MNRCLRRLFAALRGCVLGTLAVLILFEEWGWEPLARGLGRLARRPPFPWLEARIRALSPPFALAAFGLPTLLLIPVKLAALWLIGQGRAWEGVLVIVLAKLVGTALMARLFVLTQPQLMRLAWFARLYGRWHRFKTQLLDRVRASAAWQACRRTVQRLRAVGSGGER